ncbi:MAG TPA: hypothetical protein VMV25_05515 [Steroidobacteraceae bacterium]|nr:hypothetical protein [Steroidobacteraceae bacterium]
MTFVPIVTRRQLAPRSAPYWPELERGLRLFYVKPKAAAGTWVLRQFTGGRATHVGAAGSATTPLTTVDRFVLGSMSLFVRPRRVAKLAAILEPATLE